MVHKRNLKKIKLNKILKRLLSVTLIFLINFSYILPPISYSYAQVADNYLDETGQFTYLVREYGPEQIVEFEYDTLDNFSPLSSEYVSKVRNELNGGSPRGPVSRGPYDAVTVVGRVVSNIQLPDEDKILKPNRGLEGYIVMAFEHIEFGETAYFNWSHMTTTNKNGSFAIPIDKRTPGAFVVILKPERDGFRLINSYDISSEIQEEALRRSTDGIITLGEIELRESLYIKEPKEWLELLPEFISIYSKDFEGDDGKNYYTCGKNSVVYFDKYSREFEIPISLSDEPFTYDIFQNNSTPPSGGLVDYRGQFENKENKFEILNVDGETPDDKYRSIECIQEIANDVYAITELGDDQYFNVTEGGGQGNKCFNYNEQFLPLTDKYLYTNFKVQQGLLSVNYLKSTSGSSNFYSGPSSYINPYKSNADEYPSCEEYLKANNFQSVISTENRRTYAGISNLTIPETTSTRMAKGTLDFVTVYNTTACIDGTEIKTYGQLLEEGVEIPEKFLLNLYLGNNGNTRVTNLSTTVSNDSIVNDKIAKNVNPLYESGRRKLFEDNEKSDKASAVWSKISDVELDNRNIFGDATTYIYDQNFSQLPQNGFYHSVLPYYADQNDESIYIYEIGPQRSMCEQVYTNDPNNAEHEEIFIENSKINLEPNTDTDSAYTGWLLDNKNLSTLDTDEIEVPDSGNNWLFSSFFGKNFENKDVNLNKIVDEFYLTFDHYLKEVIDPNDSSSTGQDTNTIKELVTKAHEDECLNKNMVNILETSKVGYSYYYEKVRDIENYCVDTCQGILWELGDNSNCDVFVDPITGQETSDDCVLVPVGGYSLSSASSSSSSSSSGAPSLNANSQEVVDKFRSADPLVVRINNVNVNTTVEDARNVANQVVALGLPEDTIVVYGNELNNLEVEWKTVPEPEGPADASLIKQAANGYAVIFKVFAEIVKNAGLRVSPGPPDLYNGIFSGAVWAEQARSQGVYDTANALVANAYEIPEIKGIQATINELETLTGKPVDFLTEIGPHPRLSVQEHVDFLNDVSQPRNNQGRGELLKAATLIPNNCSYESSRGTPDSWLFYIRGGVYGMNGTRLNPSDCSDISGSPSGGSSFIGPHEAGLNPDIGDKISGLPVVIMLGNEYSSGGGGGGGAGSSNSLPGGWQEIKIATGLSYSCEGIREDKLKITVQDYRSEEDYLSEQRSLNDNAILFRDIFTTPFRQSYEKPYNIGKKKVELYSILENITEYAEEDVPKNKGPIAAIVAGIESLLGINNTNPTSDEYNILTHVRLISDKANNTTSSNNDYDGKTIEPAGSNLDWLRGTTRLPIDNQPLKYNKVIYRDINIEERLKDRVVITAGENIYQGQGQFGPPQNVRPPVGQLGCPIQCDPYVTCYSLKTDTPYCKHGSDFYWNYLGGYCQFPIPAYGFYPGMRKPYAPEGVSVSAFCGANYESYMEAGVVNADVYGSALDVVSRCSGNRAIFAPTKNDLDEWRVIEVDKSVGNSHVVLEGRTAEGVMKILFLHLDGSSIESNVIIGDYISAGQKIADYSVADDHLHIEMAVDDEIVVPDLYFQECSEFPVSVGTPPASTRAEYYLTPTETEESEFTDTASIGNLNRVLNESQNSSSNISISLRNLGISNANNWVNNTTKVFKGPAVDNLISKRSGSLCTTPFYKPSSSDDTLSVGVGCRETATDSNSVSETLWEEEFVQAYCYDMLTGIYNINNNFVEDLGGTASENGLDDFAKLFFDGNGRSFCELIQGYAMTVDNSGGLRNRSIGFSYDIRILNNYYGSNIIGAMTSLRNNLSSRISGIPDNNYDFFRQLTSSAYLQRMNREFKDACGGTSIMEIIGLRRGLNTISQNDTTCTN